MKFVIYYLEADSVACELPCIVGTYARRAVAEMRLAEFKRGRDPRFDSWYWLETVSGETGVFKAGA